ncbi:MBL fold metallo-hydrolase [Pseudonocardia sp. DSM 110487]|uniref:MBL fold metallo-hydrolase n=1 Tax=Pseudonocardia sp. DSM 110487 TaxID=2865833 RepID=UPI001C69E641|nr:MBL fold metallo-hydrolase [Pseudonocardia sp. DSM 110487]QYN36957.1 MBL fold metallo-hydrolase [Pseudonocardia sp. DSM 110487]
MSGLTRRFLLGGLAVGAASLTTGCVGHGPGAAPSSASAPAALRAPLTSGARTRLVLLGTAGGPNWWLDGHRRGVASAVAVGDRFYLVDAGEGVGPQIRQARLGNWESRLRGPLDALRSIFITHMHSDHVCDLNDLLVNGLANGLWSGDAPTQVWGPGNRGQLPPARPGSSPAALAPENPTPGTREMIELLKRTYATDLNDRTFENGLPDPDSFFAGHDVPIPAQYLADPNGNPHPRMSPVPFYEDDRVRVSATLVQHAPVFPALAFRFESDEGSIVFSGDTSPSENLVELASGADVLVHEVIAGEWVAADFPAPCDPVDEAIYQHLIGKHTLVEDVGPLAERAGVRTLVLNHFVPSTWPEERWEAGVRGFSGRLVVGVDLDQIGIGAP